MMKKPRNKKEKLMTVLSGTILFVFNGSTKVLANGTSGGGMQTSTGIPELDNAFAIIKAIFIGLIAVIGVIILAKGISDTAVAYQQQDSHGMYDGAKGIAAGAVMAFISVILGVLGF